MAGGEVCFQVFTKVAEPIGAITRPDVPAFKLRECCFALPALADTSDADIYRNDKHSIIGKYDKDLYTTVVISLEKYVNGSWTEQVQISDNTYGTYYSLGSLTDTTTQLNYVGFYCEWRNVLSAFGEGTYRFNFIETDFQAAETTTLYPFEFCLQNYTDERADFTTRFQWNTQGFRADWQTELDTWDFSQIPDGWDNQLRFPQSIFGGTKSEYTREFIRYQNGQQKYLQDEQVEKYTWHSGQYPAELHNFIKTCVLQSDYLTVTDYNSNNPNIFKDKAINADGNYEPDWKYNNRRAFVSVDFAEEYQNRVKKRC
jgi:hypothetical protein